MVNMSLTEKSNDDCYFYYYSTCTKGSDCQFRHCEAALGSEIVCTHWRDDKCARLQCKYRHMDTSRINRSSIQCWFETQPTGCRKPHCVFMHRKQRNLDDDSKASDRLILPLVGNTATGNANSGSTNNEGVNELGHNAKQATAYNPSKMKLIDDEDDYINNAPQDCSPPPIIDNIVDPFSISITDCEEEESDNELTKSNGKNDLKSDAFGVKTLEQIRMEKVFKQSENDCPIMDNMNETVPKPDTTANKTPVKTPTNKDLRVRIKRKVDSELRISAPNITEMVAEDIKHDPSVANFGIKTLDQIRKEREKMSANILDDSEKVVGSSDASINENVERRGEKRTASTDALNVVKIRRSGPTAVHKITNENISDNCENVTSTEVELINTVSSSSCAINNNGVNNSNNNNVNNKQRLKSLEADIEDDYDFLDGDSNIDTNNIDDDEDDELMREINQVINS